MGPFNRRRSQGQGRDARRVMLAFLLSFAVMGLFAPAQASMAAQLDDVEVKFYGYYSPDASTVVMLGHMNANDTTLAGELVSPQYADDFFGGFTIFTDHQFAADLPANYIDQIDEAVEYMVFTGNVDFYDGEKPGYVIFLNIGGDVFVIVGYQSDSDVMFDLAEQTLREVDAPETFVDYSRMDLTDATDFGNSGSTGATSPSTSRSSSSSQSTSSSSASSTSSNSAAAIHANPDAYIGEDVSLSGSVVYLTKDSSGTYLVLAVTSGGSVMGFVVGYPGDLQGVFEGDNVRVEGIVMGSETVDGTTIPLILASEVK